MSQIDDLQGRIALALDRISQSMDAGQDEDSLSEEVDRLKIELEEERTLNLQLRERNKALWEKLEAAQSAPSESVVSEKLQELGGRIKKVRENNERLREINVSLREANTQNVGEPHLINSGMIAEVEGLKSTRELDNAQMTAILNALEAALGDVDHSDAQEDV
jgi:cell division septum initiation protein DivIVA